MTECYSARCQQDRKIARREFNKWNKNILYQIGLESISKDYFQFDINSILSIDDDEQIPIDFNPNQTCLFCLNRKEYLTNQKSIHQINEYSQSMIDDDDDDENAPLDLSLKSNINSTIISNNSRTNIKQRSNVDIKSDISTNSNQEEFDRFMFNMITNQIDYPPQSYFNMNLYPTFSIPSTITNNKILSSSSPDVYIAQLAKQMAYERMLEEINSQRHLINNNNKIKNSNHSSSLILSESIHVNHILHDVMTKILHEIYDKQQSSPQQQQQPRASRKGELLFVKKQNVNNDEQYNFIHNKKKQEKYDNQSSSSSSTSSISSTGSSSIHRKISNKSSINYIPKGRSNHNSKIHIGMDGKQIRPKRGQYRRYESEQLAKAVAAVLSNEMSVHKAGSYFGVPHSTLEYKVKERNFKIKNDDDDDEEKSFTIPLNSHQSDHDLDE